MPLVSVLALPLEPQSQYFDIHISILNQYIGVIFWEVIPLNLVRILLYDLNELYVS